MQEKGLANTFNQEQKEQGLRGERRKSGRHAQVNQSTEPCPVKDELVNPICVTIKHLLTLALSISVSTFL